MAGHLLLAGLSIACLLYSLTNQSRRLYAGEAMGQIDDRYVALCRVLPADTRLGYLSDLPLSDDAGNTIFYQTQYAVAPHILLFDDAPRYVVADLAEPSLLDAYCRARRLVPVAVTAPGLALLRHDDTR